MFSLFLLPFHLSFKIFSWGFSDVQADVMTFRCHDMRDYADDQYLSIHSRANSVWTLCKNSEESRSSDVIFWTIVDLHRRSSVNQKQATSFSQTSFHINGPTPKCHLFHKSTNPKSSQRFPQFSEKLIFLQLFFLSFTYLIPAELSSERAPL